MTRRITYQVAMSLDGFIAGPDGEFDWIVQEDGIDFEALYARFDTFLLGRNTYVELKDGFLGSEAFADKRIIVFSDTLDAVAGPAVRVVRSADTDAVIGELRAEAGMDIWLYGGGELFRSLLERGHVDTVETAMIPILLGRGRRFLPETATRAALRLTGHTVYGDSGIVLLEYKVANSA